MENGAIALQNLTLIFLDCFQSFLKKSLWKAPHTLIDGVTELRSNGIRHCKHAKIHHNMQVSKMCHARDTL